MLDTIYILMKHPNFAKLADCRKKTLKPLHKSKDLVNGVFPCSFVRPTQKRTEQITADMSLKITLTGIR